MDSVFYLGACSPQGFASHYDSLLHEHLRLNIIKGGSGCGKSTFMRRIGRAAQERGLDVSYILCSSDPDSLDGVVIPALETAFVDGTAPHVLEPSLCGGSMNYVNFGAFYDRAAMRQSEDKIRAAQALNAAQYPHVTACLSAADKLLDSVRAVTSACAYTEQTTSLAECLALSVLRPSGESPRTAERFLSAVTPKGLRFCTQTPAALCARVYVLRDNYLLAPRLLSRLHELAQAGGHACVVCHSPLLPEGAPSHLLLPTADAAFITETRDFPYDGPCFCRIDLDAILPQEARRSLTFCGKTVSSLLYQAASHLREAKRQHDRIEALCHPFVDFEAVDDLTQRTILDLFGEK